MLTPLEVIDPEGLNPVTTTGEWEEIILYVDSGATETVISKRCLSSIQVKEGAAFKRGVKYEVANGIRIPNLGEKTFKATSAEGVVRSITAQVCDVNKGLLSVKKITAAGNRVGTYYGT